MIVQGTSFPGNGRYFYNVPYAHAGRWEEPTPARWKGTLDATAIGTACMQPGMPNAVEDCLSLNVMTPHFEEEGASLPVFVWFFGGGYMYGSASDFAGFGSHPVEHLLSHDLLMVVPDFRLGLFGYLGSNRARRNSTGNWGILDQVMSLKWVSSYISKFGGDPMRVTIGGWSSGAAAVSVLLSMASNEGLVHGAIMMSGGFTDWAAFPLDYGEKQYDALLQQTGCTTSVDCSLPGVPCECLLAIPADKLLNIEGCFTWGPIVDGVVLHAEPYKALKNHKVLAVPIIAGSTLEDDFPFSPDDATDADFRAWLQRKLPATDVDTAYELYLGSKYRPDIDWIHGGASAAHWAGQRAKGDRTMSCVARRVVRYWPAAAWEYLWHTRFPGEEPSLFGPGICHSSDQHFLFQKMMPAGWQPAAAALQQAVSLFVHSKNPGKQWPHGGERGMVFYQHGPVPRDIRSEQCNFWDAIDGV
jgi:carboxylesterase type B